MDIVKASRDYCDLVVGAEGYERDAFVSASVQRLAAVISAAADLPRVPLSEEEPDEDVPDISHQEWFERFRAIQDVLDDWDTYWAAEPVLLPASGQGQPEQTLGSLSDDLADTWRDLAAGLRWIDTGGDPVLAHWEWRFGFYAHWGAHAIDALRVLRSCIAATEISDDQAEGGATE